VATGSTTGTNAVSISFAAGDRISVRAVMGNQTAEVAWALGP
jgi:hypothetical protein